MGEALITTQTDANRGGRKRKAIGKNPGEGEVQAYLSRGVQGVKQME